MLLKEWQKEKETLHILSQILGKYKLESMYQEPQWAHVALDITIQGFSTGMLHYEDKDFLIEVNLIDNIIEVRINNNKESIKLENGTTIQTYYNKIKQILTSHGIHLEINTKPQEVADTTPIDQDTHHHHYKSDVANNVLDLMKFAYHAETKFISSLRVRKFKPALFWGTFDISCAMINSEHRPFSDDNKVIERAAFDEELIEFGFWFGDDNYEGPTFFVLPYPFTDKQFECHQKFPDNSKFDPNLGEFILEINSDQQPSHDTVSQFFYESYNILKDDLNWGDCSHFHLPLKMKNNHLTK